MKLIRKACKDRKLAIPTKRTLYKYIDGIDVVEALRVRQGEKVAYQQTAFEFMNIDSSERLGATRFLQYCHIDHTQVDVEVFSNSLGSCPERPYLTLIIDEFTGMILGKFLSFQPPSYVSVMVLLRMMVAEHELLPECFVVDGGKEFKGYDFELLAAFYSIAIKSREGQPRGGLVIERQFGSLNTQFFHNIEGNTKFMKDPRSVTKTHNPKKTVRWSLSQLNAMLDIFIESYHSTAIKQGAMTPLELRSTVLFGKALWSKNFFEKS